MYENTILGITKNAVSTKELRWTQTNLHKSNNYEWILTHPVVQSLMPCWS